MTRSPSPPPEVLEPDSFKVQVIYALSEGVQTVEVTVMPGTTIAHAVEKSGLVAPDDLHHAQLKVAVYGRLKRISQAVEPGDRIELLRPLLIDPNRARLLRAKKKAQSPPS